MALTDDEKEVINLVTWGFMMELESRGFTKEHAVDVAVKAALRIAVDPAGVQEYGNAP